MVAQSIILIIDFDFAAVLVTIVATASQLVLKHHGWLHGQSLITTAHMGTALLSLLAVLVYSILVLVDVLPMLA